MPDSLLRFDHVALRVREPEASLSFYGETLGLPLLASFSGPDWDGMEWLMMIFGLRGGHQLALCAFGGPCEEGVAGVSDLPHYAFSVGYDAALDAWRERLSCAGLDFKDKDTGPPSSNSISQSNHTNLENTPPT